MPRNPKPEPKVDNSINDAHWNLIEEYVFKQCDTVPNPGDLLRILKEDWKIIRSKKKLEAAVKTLRREKRKARRAALQAELDEMFGKAPATQDPQFMSAEAKIGKAVESLTKSVNVLIDKVAALEAKPPAAPAPPPRSQPAAGPDEVEIDLSDPEVLKAIKEEISAQVDTTIRTLRGQLPD